MGYAQLVIAANTLWVVVAAALVMFMQAGFALLEAGLNRMKNAGHIAAKNLLIYAICVIVFWLAGYGISFGKGNLFWGLSGFVPSASTLMQIHGPIYPFIRTVPAAAGFLFEVAFAGVSLAIIWGGMAERARLYVYIVMAVVYTLIYSTVAHWIWGGGFLYRLGMQDFAGSTVVHFQGSLGALAGAILLGPRIGKYEKDGTPNAIPGHNIPFSVLGGLILWLGWFGFNAGSTLAVSTGDTVGFFSYVALTTNLAAAGGVIGALFVAWTVLKVPDMSMMVNGAIGALVAITAASGYVAPWAGLIIGIIAGAISVGGVLWVEKMQIDDPVGAVSVHGMSGIWGTLACGLFTLPQLAKLNNVGQGGLIYTGSFHQLGVQALGILVVGIFTFTTVYLVLWALKRTFGIRVSPETELAGLDIEEHGMWGYPEFYIPVPGGYGTEMHSHLQGTSLAFGSPELLTGKSVSKSQDDKHAD